MNKRSVLTIALITLMALLVVKFLAPDPVAEATAGETHSQDEALLMMVHSELWLIGGGDPVALNGQMDFTLPVAHAGSQSDPLLSVPTSNRYRALLDMAAAPLRSARQTEVEINAVKAVIAMKQTAHEQSANMLEGKISQEAVQAHEQKHQLEMQKLNGQLEELRKEWRRQRRFWSKVTKPFKQAGGWFWHKIGPAGRRLLRNVGEDLIRIAVTGDPVSGRVIRMLIIKHARTMGEAKGTEFLMRLYLGGRQRQKQNESQATTIDEAAAEIEKESFEEIWAGIERGLESDQLNCQSYQIELFKECLEGNSDDTTEWLDVVALCKPVYDQIRRNDPGGTITVSRDIGYDDPAGPGERITYDMTYPSAGGQVAGSYDFYFDGNIDGCRQTIKATLSGNYTLIDCSMSGTAIMSYKVQPLTEIEGWGVYERDHCFETGNIEAREDAFDVPVPWQATLKNGDLSVSIGEEDCNGGPFCQGFSFDVWEDGKEDVSD